MVHSFDVDIAKEYGLNEAIILNHIWFWIAKNEANEQNFYDGSFWTYNSIKAFSKQFSYLSPRKISNAIKNLVELGILKTGVYNANTYDRTLWYAFTEKGYSIMQKREMEEPKKENGDNKKGKSYKEQIINTDNKTQIINQYGENLGNIICTWIDYKNEIKKPYTPVGFKSLLTQIQNQVNIHGEKIVADLIVECMANQYQGIIWDRIKNVRQEEKPSGTGNKYPTFGIVV